VSRAATEGRPVRGLEARDECRHRGHVGATQVDRIGEYEGSRLGDRIAATSSARTYQRAARSKCEQRQGRSQHTGKHATTVLERFSVAACGRLLTAPHGGQIAGPVKTTTSETNGMDSAALLEFRRMMKNTIHASRNSGLVQITSHTLDHIAALCGHDAARPVRVWTCLQPLLASPQIVERRPDPPRIVAAADNRDS
jgi:hypothetical protein